MIQISVIIPTFRRPESFLRAARSVFAQHGVGPFEIVAVDNSPEGSARAAFATLAEEAPCAFRCAHEPNPGVASARNAALKLARGRYVAWLDDDEEAGSEWLANLLAAHLETGAQSVFGPVRARAHVGAANADFYERIYSRRGPAIAGFVGRAYGIGNSLQPRAVFEGEAAFDVRADETGGEDDRFFAALAQAGARFAWAPEAAVVEHLGPERTRLRHGLKRAFAYGQGPSQAAWAAKKPLQLLRHMGVGIAQMLVCSAASALVAAGSGARALALLELAARGAGKVFWVFRQRFYGAALVTQPARLSARSIAITGASAPV
jgi:hypothetical protein